MTCKHLVLTRWNLSEADQSVYNHPQIGDPEQWMHERQDIFDRFCVPMMQAQTNKDFTWILSFDVLTPGSVLDKYRHIEGLEVKLIFEPHRKWVQANYESFQTDWLITSRIDNDDFYFPNALKIIREYFDNVGAAGLFDIMHLFWKINEDKFYHDTRLSPNSPFISIMESLKQMPETVFKDQHTYMFRHFQPSNKIKSYMAVAIIHGQNLAPRESMNGPVSDTMDINIRDLIARHAQKAAP